jgi:hypothetical protein
MIHRNSRTLSRLLALGLCAAAVGAVSCGDLTGVPASLPTLTDSGTVYAINGAPPGAPTALHVFSGSILNADATFIFDVAFDIDGNGRVVYLPQKTVASGLAPTHSVGLQATTATFDAVTAAPKSGYRPDTALVANPGTVVLVQTSDANACGISLTGSTLYGKVQVELIDPQHRTLKVRWTVNPNCGFFSFASGIPKD